MGQEAVVVFHAAAINGAVLAMALIILLPVTVLAAVVYFVLREIAKDRRKRSLDLPADYYRQAPPPLPPQRNAKGPPDPGRRR